MHYASGSCRWNSKYLRDWASALDLSHTGRLRIARGAASAPRRRTAPEADVYVLLAALARSSTIRSPPLWLAALAAGGLLAVPRADRVGDAAHCAVLIHDCVFCRNSVAWPMPIGREADALSAER